MWTIMVSVSIVVSVCAAGCTTEVTPVVPDGEFLVTVSDDAPETRDALGALRISEQPEGMQIALTLAELVWPGEPGGFRAVVFFEPGQCRAFVHESEIWPEGMEATYGLAGTQAVREIRRVRMWREGDGTADIELNLGAAETTDGTLGPVGWPASATAHALGHLRVTCSMLGEPDEFGARHLVEDPYLTTDFCSRALMDLGLAELAL